MKRLLVIMITFLFFASCEKKEEKPKSKACFDFSPNEDIKIGDEILFSNCSENSSHFIWDFGDGHLSTDTITKHKYKNSGEFKIKLSAINEHSVDSISKVIKIREWTKSEIITSTIWSAYLIQLSTAVSEIPGGGIDYFYFSFNNNGSLLLEAKSQNELPQNLTCKWSIFDNTILLEIDGEKESWIIKELSVQKLIIQNNEFVISFKPKSKSQVSGFSNFSLTKKLNSISTPCPLLIKQISKQLINQ